jgi:class 3 adenylate cyclase/tetratricopeptide (TPR) repeat protein
VSICPSCGEQNPAGKKFCGECGAPLSNAPASPAREVRKTVTVLFSDVSGSTALGERLDPESLRAVMGRYFAAMKAVIERHGGTVEKFIGDAVMAVFGIPLLHEDDALRAVRAAAEMRDALEALNRELESERGVRIAVRTGINTGEVVAGDPAAGHTLVTGDTVNTAARLEQAAAAGEILLGEATHRLVRDAVAVEPVPPVDAKGKALPVPALRLVSVTADAEAHTRRLDAPLVGRERELDRLRDAFEQAVRDTSSQLFTLLGPAGVGKSRLVAEFVASVSTDATVLRGRCLPYGEGITYWPVGEVVKQAAGIEETDNGDEARAKVTRLLEGERDAPLIASRVEAAIGLATDSAPQEELFWAIRKLLEHLARRRPLVVVWDDIHWAEPTFLDLVEHIADLSRDAPLLLLCPARPELLDTRTGWGGGKLNATTILLEPLAADATERLIDALPGGSALPELLRRRILEAAEGNPLYIEEMLAMLVDEGLLVERLGGWQVEGESDRVRVPPTISALLAARLEQLAPDERALAERAAVVGRVFEQAAVTELAPEGLRAGVARGLVALVRKELVRPERSELSAGDAFKFRHILIRDAAYDALPKSERAELHERFADWLERTVGERAPEYQEILGHHLEQAHRFRSDLGETGERVEALRQRAGEQLAASGRGAYERGDARAARGLLERAVTLLPLDSRDRIRSLLLLGDVLTRSESPATALAIVNQARQQADALGEESLLWQAQLLAAELEMAAGFRDMTSMVAPAREALEAFRRLHDAWGESRALGHLSTLVSDLGRNAEGMAEAELAADAARRAGDRALEARSLGAVAGCMLYGPADASETVRWIEAVLPLLEDQLRTRAIVLTYASEAYAMRERFEEARALLRQAVGVLHDLGDARGAAGSRMNAGVIELRAREPLAAERELRAGDDALEAMGERHLRSTVAGLLAEALVQQQRHAEAERYVEVTRELAAPDDFASQVLWRRALALCLAERGDLDAAEKVAREAVALAAATDDLNEHGDALLRLAEVVSLVGRASEAVTIAESALELYGRKGNLAALRRTREVMGGWT